MKVTGFEKIERFKDFSLIKNRGEHSFCKFSFMATRFDDYSELVGKSVKIIEDNRNLMFGIVEEVKFVTGNTENIVKVTIISKSSELDKKKMSRIFQKEDQTYKEILDEISRKIGYELNVPISLKEAELAHPIIQKNETDYNFIKRLLYEAYSELIIVDVGIDKIINVGYIDDSTYEIKSNEVISMELSLNEKGSEIVFVIQGGVKGLEFRQFVDIGKKVCWQGKSYIINFFEVEKVEGVYRYKCKAICDFEIEASDKNQSQQLLLKAKVVDVDDPNKYGRVRLEFLGDNIEDMTTDNKVWNNVLTSYTAKNGGFVFVPDVDDVVEVIWNGIEFVVIGCLRQEPLAERYQDVKLKQIGNLYDKNICFAEDKLEITSKETTVTLLDEEVQVLVKDSMVTISKDKIDVDTSKSKVQINNDITIDTGKVHVDTDEMENNVKKKYVCESRNITLNSSSTVTIAGKTKVSIN